MPHLRDLALEKARFEVRMDVGEPTARDASHFYIKKNFVGDRTVTTVTPLTPEERVEEIARMLGGVEMTEAVVQHAREMLSHALPAPARAGT